MSLGYKRPPQKLMRELEEVAASADALGLLVNVARPNIQLDRFPVKELSALCSLIAILPQGTAEGCREPLIYARKRISSIRRERIAMQSIDSSSAEQERPPPLSRGDSLDERLVHLIGSISTALDQYMNEFRTDIPDDFVSEIEVAVERERIRVLCQAHNIWRPAKSWVWRGCATLCRACIEFNLHSLAPRVSMSACVSF